MKEFLIGAAALAAVGPVLAQAVPPPPPSPAPERIQTRDQVVAKVRQHFVRLDTNRDGFIVRAEADAGQDAMRERVVKKLRERGDERSDKAFARMDANKDGAISREEFDKVRLTRIERRIDRIEDGQAPRARRVPMGGMHRFGGRMFDMADANKDQRVSLEEATNAAAQHFDRMDVNRDGRLTREERRQMRRAHRAPVGS